MKRVRFRSPGFLLLAGLSSACALTRVADEAAEKPLRLGTGVYVGHSSARGGDAAAGAAGTLASRVEDRHSLVVGLRHGVLFATDHETISHAGFEVDLQGAGHGYVAELTDPGANLVAFDETDSLGAATVTGLVQHTREDWAPYAFLGGGFSSVLGDYPFTLAYGVGVKFYLGLLVLRVEARAHRIDTDGTLVDPTTNLGLSYSDDITLEQLLIGISLVP